MHCFSFSLIYLQAHFREISFFKKTKYVSPQMSLSLHLTLLLYCYRLVSDLYKDLDTAAAARRLINSEEKGWQITTTVDLNQLGIVVSSRDGFKE